MRFNIGAKIGIVFFIFFIELVLLVTLSSILASRYENYIHELKEEIEELDLVKSLQLALDQMLMPVNDFLIAGADKNEPENFRVLNTKAEDLIFRLDKREFGDAEEKEIFNSIKEGYGQVKGIAMKIFSMPDAVGNIEAGRLTEEMDKIAYDTLQEAEEFHQFSHREIEEMGTVWLKTKSFLQLLILAIIISNLILLLASLFFIRRSIIKPIYTLKDAALEVGRGKLDRKVNILSKDEMGELGYNFNKMLDELKIAKDDILSQIEQRKKIEEELKNKVQQLEAFNKITIDRELKMVELKEEIGRFKEQLKEKDRQ